MNELIPRATMTCRNCGEPIHDNGNSPTGLAHVATERARCDGESLDNGLKRAQRTALLETVDLAVAQ